MTEPEFVPLFVASRANSLINLIDAFQFTDSELVDMYMAITHRLRHLIDLTDTPTYKVAESLTIKAPSLQDCIEASDEYTQELRHDH